SFTTDQLAQFCAARELKLRGPDFDKRRYEFQSHLQPPILTYFEKWAKKDVIENPNSTTTSCCGSHTHCVSRNIWSARAEGMKIGGVDLKSIPGQDVPKLAAALMHDAQAVDDSGLKGLAAFDSIRKYVPDIDRAGLGWSA